MADADLDVIIRQLAKQQYKSLMAAAKSRRDHYTGLAAKAKNDDAKLRFKQLAKVAFDLGSAAAKRLQMSADNTADSYARALRRAADTPLVKAVKPVVVKKVDAKKEAAPAAGKKLVEATPAKKAAKAPAGKKAVAKQAGAKKAKK